MPYSLAFLTSAGKSERTRHASSVRASNYSCCLSLEAAAELIIFSAGSSPIIGELSRTVSINASKLCLCKLYELSEHEQGNELAAVALAEDGYKQLLIIIEVDVFA